VEVVVTFEQRASLCELILVRSEIDSATADSYLGDVSKSQNFIVNELNDWAVVLMNLANMDRVWLNERVVVAVDL
jgi:hypothetical protein